MCIQLYTNKNNLDSVTYADHRVAIVNITTGLYYLEQEHDILKKIDQCYFPKCVTTTLKLQEGLQFLPQHCIKLIVAGLVLL